MAGLFHDFCLKLDEFSYYFAGKSAPEKFGATYLQSILTPEEYSEWDVPEHKRPFIKETNRLADEAWKQMELLMPRIRSRVPEAFDEKIEMSWFRTNENLY